MVLVINLKIPIDVIPQGRPRVVKFRAYDPPKCAKFKSDFATLVKAAFKDDKLLNYPLKVEIKIFRNFKRPTARRYGDIDNLAKGILDALNGILWQDDSQIVSLKVDKYVTDDSPFVDLSVSRTGDSIFGYF